ncbi:MAG: DUF92 domain-containing protein [Thermoplasmata archaeon]
MLGLVDAAIGVAITIGLAAVAVAGKALTPVAAAVAAVFGAVIVVVGGFPYLGILALFVFASALATRYHIDEKAARALQEGQHGERGISNVLAHIFLPTVLVLIAALLPVQLPAEALSFLYASAIAFGASDTFASEFGVLAGAARSILTGKPVAPGTNGGVSVAGELFAFVGAFLTAVVALALYVGFGTPTVGTFLFIGGVTAAGFLACQVDSVLGETLENRGWLSKGSTNFVGMGASIAIGLAFIALAGAAI